MDRFTCSQLTGDNSGRVTGRDRIGRRPGLLVGCWWISVVWRYGALDNSNLMGNVSPANHISATIRSGLRGIHAGPELAAAIHRSNRRSITFKFSCAESTCAHKILILKNLVLSCTCILRKVRQFQLGTHVSITKIEFWPSGLEYLVSEVDTIKIGV
jgi:hypothetical protein